MPKHGKAPFTVSSRDYAIVDATGRTIAMVPLMEQGSYNTKLLIAAPELLAALKTALSALTLTYIAIGKPDSFFAGYATGKTKAGALAQILSAIEVATGFRPKFLPDKPDSATPCQWFFVDD